LQITFAVTCYHLVGYGFFNIFNLKRKRNLLQRKSLLRKRNLLERKNLLQRKNNLVDWLIGS
jgi:hypothetical protein